MTHDLEAVTGLDVDLCATRTIELDRDYAVLDFDGERWTLGNPLGDAAIGRVDWLRLAGEVVTNESSFNAASAACLIRWSSAF